MFNLLVIEIFLFKRTINRRKYSITVLNCYLLIVFIVGTKTHIDFYSKLYI